VPLGELRRQLALRADGTVAADARHSEGEIIEQVTKLTETSLVVAAARDDGRRTHHR